LQRATAELIGAMAARPDDYASQYNLANIYMQQRKIDRALASYKTSIKLRPDFFLPYVNIAFAYNAKGQNEMAEQSFRKALTLDPDNIVAQTNLAILLGEMGRTHDAETAFRKVLTIDPNSATAAFNLAVLLTSTNPDESLSLSKKALVLRPDEPRYAYTYAFYLHQAGKINNAIKILHGIVDRHIPYSDAYIMLGRIYEDQGKSKEAVKVYRNAAANKKLPEYQRRNFSAKISQTQNR
jgi:tetratricopeptide (TPR) repeat protein